MGTKALGEDVPDREVFEKDRLKVERILRRHGAFPPAASAASQLKSPTSPCTSPISTGSSSRP
jgi:hypothetical protein